MNNSILMMHLFEAGKRNKEVNHSDNILLENEKQCEEYKLPLVWIDLEMTGKDIITCP